MYIEDIAHALSLITRGNGHVKTFFSVGQHCINCAKEAELRGFSDRVILACLLHDAGECYMSDVPRPFKKELPRYIELEDALLTVLYTKFLGSPLTEEEAVLVKSIDDDMLWYDMKELLGETLDRPMPSIRLTPDYTFRPFQEVEQEYLFIYGKMMNRLM